MSLGQPVSEFGEHVCPKCGAVQESPGSTVCEQCGADLKVSATTGSAAPRPAPQLKHPTAKISLKQPPRFGQLLGMPLRILGMPFRLARSALEALLLLVLSILSFALRVIVLGLRIAVTLGVIAAIVVGLSYVPVVRARAPVMKEVPEIAKQWVSAAVRTGASIVTGLMDTRKRQQARPQPPAPRATSQQRRPPSRTVASKQPAVTSKRATPARAAATYAVVLKSMPTGATVQFNERQVGKTPLTIKVAPGTYRVTISRPGYTSVRRTIIVRAGRAASVSVTLIRARPAPRRTPPIPAPTPPTESPRGNDP